MSLFGAMNTAISGLNAQSASFANISDNVANSQTVGFKRTDTAFIDFLTTSNATENSSGAVVARPNYINNVQGTVAQSDNPLALAITGQGFFPVSLPTGATSATGTTPTFSALPNYTRTGDFSMNNTGYLVNSAGEYLNGWAVNSSTGQVNRNSVAPIKVNQSVYNPVATSNVTLAANLPATPSSSPLSSLVNVYDGLGTVHTVTLSWTQNATNDWTVAVNVPDDTSGTVSRGTAEVQFGVTSGNWVADGTIGNIINTTSTVAATPFSTTGDATLSFTSNFGQGNQTINVNLGQYGASLGLTQYAGTTYSLRSLSQDGVPPGAFSSISTKATGDIVVNYDNGQTRTIARVPVVTFADPNALQRTNGQAFTATLSSGSAVADDAGSNGAGALIVGSIEQSNVDIAQEFSKLIVAQRAYSANTKLVTTADELLQQTIDMKR